MTVKDSKCPNGHPVGQQDKFCTQCGMPVGPIVAAVATPAPTSSPPAKERSATATEKRAPQKKGVARWQWITLGVIGVAFVGFLVFSSVNGGGSNSTEAETVAPTSEGLTPEETAIATCVQSIAPLVDSLIDNDGSDAAMNAAVNDVAREFGVNDPRYRLVIDAHGKWTAEAYRNGRDSATALTGEFLTDWCRNNPGY